MTSEWVAYPLSAGKAIGIVQSVMRSLPLVANASHS
jgi:hypothetical protein